MSAPRDRRSGKGATEVLRADLRAPDPRLEAELRRRLDEVEEGLRGAVASDIALVRSASSHLLGAGGKRFRPMLVVLGGRFGPRPEDASIVDGAVATELTHLASLHHDDVIDEADTRRGIASVNARWGNTVAVLTGDFLFARASQIAAALGADASRLLAATIAAVCEGQILELQ
ncbi:MAG: polyprenyl synthetase family protein, partial [Actinomycetota bacterium]|nr:polyprenyl synthetase family protein [Actinomycetota bacterium]